MEYPWPVLGTDPPFDITIRRRRLLVRRTGLFSQSLCIFSTTSKGGGGWRRRDVRLSHHAFTFSTSLEPLTPPLRLGLRLLSRLGWLAGWLRSMYYLRATLADWLRWLRCAGSAAQFSCHSLWTSERAPLGWRGYDLGTDHSVSG